MSIINDLILELSQMDAVRGVSEACDQSVVNYSAGANGADNEEMRRMRKL